MERLTKLSGNIVIVDKFTHRISGVKKGDFLVSGVPTDGHLVLKRICGSAGRECPSRHAVLNCASRSCMAVRR